MKQMGRTGESLLRIFFGALLAGACCILLTISTAAQQQQTITAHHTHHPTQYQEKLPKSLPNSVASSGKSSHTTGNRRELSRLENSSGHSKAYASRHLVHSGARGSAHPLNGSKAPAHSDKINFAYHAQGNGAHRNQKH